MQFVLNFNQIVSGIIQGLGIIGVLGVGVYRVLRYISSLEAKVGMLTRDIERIENTLDHICDKLDIVNRG